MYLKRLKLAGFKSFVDPTLIPVRGQMSAIVGPNGCGKSNVVDAIRWVVGETSAKQLRGQSMSDVIFNGTTQRKPVGKASVELIFDNEDGRLGGEYAQYAEIAVRREVERDGQSSYFLNGVNVRRRDVIDLFLGTGLGPRSYAIIEQGMISHLIEAKPDEMRVYIEEAAGISKYKERRRETENRMQHTQENLDRINDIREELDKQLRHLKRQANAAERYKVYKQEERLLTSQIKALQWKALDQKKIDQEQLINQQAVLQEEKRSEQSHLETEMEKVRVTLTEANEKNNVVQKEFYGLGAEIARLEQRIKDTQDQYQHWQKEVEEIDHLQKEIQENTFECEQQISELETEITDLKPQSERGQSEALTAEQALAKAEAEMHEWEKNWEIFQSQASRASSDSQVTRTKVDHYQEQHAELTQRKQEIHNNLQHLPLSPLRAELEPLGSHAGALDQKLRETTTKLQTYADEINSLRQTNQSANAEVQNIRRELQTAQARHASLDALQKSALGTEDEETNQWLSQKGLSKQPRLGQSLRVNAGWELAVETVMSGYFDAVCVDAVEDFIGHLENLSKGRLTLLEKKSPARLEHTNAANTLVSQVNGEWPLQQWLEGVYTANTIEEAKKIRANLNNGESVVTKDGVWMGINWVRLSKQQDAQSGFLLREQQLKQLHEQISTLTRHSEEKERELNRGEQRLSQLESDRDALHRHHQSLMEEMTDVQTKLSSKQTHLDDILARQARLQQALADCTTQLQKIEAAMSQSESELNRFQGILQSQNQQRETMRNDREQYRDQVRALREAAQQQRKEADESAIRLSANENQLTLLKQTISRYQRQSNQLQERHETLSRNLSETDSPLESLNRELQSQLDNRLKVEARLRESEQHVAGLSQSLQELDSQRNTLQKAINEMQGRFEELRMERQTLVVRQTTIQEQLSESDIDLQKILNELPPEITMESQETQLADVSQRLQRLGAINLAAIEEYDSTNERKTYLDRQHDDLAEALTILQEAIRKIDRETRSRFQETYDRINQNLQNLFPKIFGGGQACLEMTEEDLLTTGVMVRAQPPGKRNTTIHLLSGGEKALTAIALVFSLFQLNPAPFCILDEVDAPLDDVNVGRFCQLVKEMAKSVQFLIISHNKVTIEMGDHLMGVTMQEPGVSRIVSVDMKEALNLVEAA